jgi:hypothetical protein
MCRRLLLQPFDQGFRNIFDRQGGHRKLLLHSIHNATIVDTIPWTNVWSSLGQKGGRIVILPVDMKHGEINKELGLPSDYTTTVETFMHSLGLP